MADVQLVHVGDLRDRLDVAISKAVPGMEREAILPNERGALLQMFEFGLLFFANRRVAVFAGVQLDGWCIGP